MTSRCLLGLYKWRLFYKLANFQQVFFMVNAIFYNSHLFLTGPLIIIRDNNNIYLAFSNMNKTFFNLRKKPTKYCTQFTPNFYFEFVYDKTRP